MHPDELAEVPARGLSVPAAQKTENFFFIFFELHFGQVISWFPKTSFSKSSPQLLHVYSKIGIFSPCYENLLGIIFGYVRTVMNCWFYSLCLVYYNRIRESFLGAQSLLLC